MRTVTVSYPVPFIFAGLLAVFFFSFTGAAVLPVPMNWMFAAAGIIAFLIAAGIAIYAVVRRPDLLRSERHQQAIRLIQIVGDKEMDQAARAEFMTALLGNDTKPRGRRGTRMGEHDG
ncbi:MAG: hypothetical protein QOD93_5227 [Acetobacteraceae bacterium]|nr:hypothetical protein [Acetobacteraceae bacterium]